MNEYESLFTEDGKHPLKRDFINAMKIFNRARMECMDMGLSPTAQYAALYFQHLVDDEFAQTKLEPEVRRNLRDEMERQARLNYAKYYGR